MNHRRLLLVLLWVVGLGAAFGQALPTPDVRQLPLAPSLPALADEKPHWIDATPIFHDMAVEAAKRFTPGIRRSPREGVPVGGETTFWAMNIAANQFVEVTAVLRKVGKHCYIYVEKGREVAPATIDAIAARFDDRIYPTNTRTFGSEPKPGIDGDDRVTLLMLDIQDGWEPGKGYVGGYFFPLNEYSKRDFPQSNEREMLYLDLHPSDPTSEDYLGVVAHEFQHLIHWNHDAAEPKWVNEGCSQYAYHVCGYGHPSQIMAFTQKPDHTLATWKNTIDDYGAVYLFFYYLFQKYGDDTGALSRAVVADKARGIAGIDAALARCGVKADFGTIFADWSVANILADPKVHGGKFGYDPTLPVKVWSRTLDLANLPAAAADAVAGWATDYHQVSLHPFWQPAAPTLADVVEIELPGPGLVIWSIDDGIAPPAALWPPDTKELEPGRSVRTRITADQPKFRVGPFHGNPVRKLNVSLYNRNLVALEHAQIPVAADRVSLLPPEGTLRFEIKGKKGFIGSLFGKKPALQVRLLREAEKVELGELVLDKNLAGAIETKLGATDRRITLLVGNRSDKDGEYELTARYTAAPTFAGLLAGLERGEHLLGRIAPLVTAGAKSLDPLSRSVTDQFADLTRQATMLLDPTVAGAATAEANARFLAKQGARPGFFPLLKAVSEKIAFAESHGEPWPPAVVGALKPVLGNSAGPTAPVDDTPGTPPTNGHAGTSDPADPSAPPPPEFGPRALRADDADTSHTNIQYLCNKKQELIHALTHLKIDPNFIEGQILQMYKLLQVSLNLPNLPIPDGFAIVDYDESAAQAYVDRLRKGATAEEKEALKRLTLYEDVTEKLYNTNLVMAEDFGWCLYELARLILTGRATLLSIAGGLQDVPVVGTITQKVVKVIIARSLNLVTRVTNLLAVKIKAPYNSIVPMVVHLGANMAAKWLKLPPTNENQGAMRPWAAKTAAKYLFASLPKVGYVAKTQALVDAGVAAAERQDLGGTLADATRLVLDDGDPNTATSLHEDFVLRLSRKHAFTAKEIEAAGIAKVVAQIAAYASVIDPTCISKVVAGVSAVAAGGALTHGMVSSIHEFYQTPKALERALRLAFHPESPLPVTKSAVGRVPIAAGKIGSSMRLLGTLKHSYRSELSRLQQAIAAGDGKACAARVEALVGFEEQFEAADRQWSAVAEASLAGTVREGELEATMQSGIRAEHARAQLLADLLPVVAGATPDQPLREQAEAAGAAMDQYLGLVTRILATKVEADMMPRVAITGVSASRTDSGWKISAVASLLAPAAGEVSFTLLGAPDTVITSSPRPQHAEPWTDLPLEWTVTGPATAQDAIVTVVGGGEGLAPGVGLAILP